MSSLYAPVHLWSLSTNPIYSSLSCNPTVIWVKIHFFYLWLLMSTKCQSVVLYTNMLRVLRDCVLKVWYFPGWYDQSASSTGKKMKSQKEHLNQFHQTDFGPTRKLIQMFHPNLLWIMAPWEWPNPACSMSTLISPALLSPRISAPRVLHVCYCRSPISHLSCIYSPLQGLKSTVISLSIC